MYINNFKLSICTIKGEKLFNKSIICPKCKTELGIPEYVTDDTLCDCAVCSKRFTLKSLKNKIDRYDSDSWTKFQWENK